MKVHVMAQANVGNAFLAQNSTGNPPVTPGIAPIRKPNPSTKNVPDIPFLQGMPDAYVVSPADWQTEQGYIKKNLEIGSVGPVPEIWMLAGILFVILGAFVTKRWLIPRRSNQTRDGGSTASNPGPGQSPFLSWGSVIALKRLSAEVLRWLVCLGIIVLIVDLQVRKYEINNESKTFQSRYAEGNWAGAVDALDRIIHLRAGAFCNVLFRNFCVTFARIPVEDYVTKLQEAILAASDPHPTPEQAVWLERSAKLKKREGKTVIAEGAAISDKLQYETLVRMISYHLKGTDSKPSSDAQLALEYAEAARDLAREDDVRKHAAFNLTVARYHRTIELLGRRSLAAAKRVFASIERSAIPSRAYALLDACVTEQEFERKLEVGSPGEAVDAVIACRDRSSEALSADDWALRRFEYDIALGYEQIILKETIYRTDIDKEQSGRFLDAATKPLRFLTGISPEFMRLPEDAQMRLLFLAGFERQQAGEYDLAVKDFRDAQKAAPSQQKEAARTYLTEALVICAKNHLRHGRTDAAVESAREANKLDPKSWEVTTIFRAALLTRIRFYRQTGDPTKAAVDFNILSSEGKPAPASVEAWGISGQDRRVKSLRQQAEITWLGLPDIIGEIPIDTDGNGSVDFLLFYDASKTLCAVATMSSSNVPIHSIVVLDSKKRLRRQIMSSNGSGWFDSVLLPQSNGEKYLYDPDGDGKVDIEATTSAGEVLGQKPLSCTITISSISATMPSGIDFIGPGDGFVKIAFDDEDEWHFSSVQNNVVDPVWSFRLSHRIEESGRVRVQLWDKDLPGEEMIEDWTLRPTLTSYGKTSFLSARKWIEITMESVVPVLPKGFKAPRFESTPNLELPSFNIFEGEDLRSNVRAHMTDEYRLFRSTLEQEAKANRLLAKGDHSERWFARQPLAFTDPDGTEIAETTVTENRTAPAGMAPMLVGSLCAGIVILGGILNYKFLRKNDGTAVGNCTVIAVLIGGLFGVFGVMAVFGRALFLALDPKEIVVWAPLRDYLTATFLFSLILAFKAYFGLVILGLNVASVFYGLQQHGSWEILSLFKIVTDFVLGSAPPLVRTFMTLLLSIWCMLTGLFGLSSYASNRPMSASEFFDTVT
jgi:tetratricopeptide (TPR) repeat protein